MPFSLGIALSGGCIFIARNQARKSRAPLPHGALLFVFAFVVSSHSGSRLIQPAQVLHHGGFLLCGIGEAHSVCYLRGDGGK